MGQAEPESTAAESGPALTETELIITHLNLVEYLVNSWMNKLPDHITRDDLRSAGYEGLVLAARNFDVSRGVSFATYASRRISGAIRDELRSMDWASRSARQRSKQIGKMALELTAEQGTQPTRRELAEATGLTRDQISAVQLQISASAISLEAGRELGLDPEDPEPDPSEQLQDAERTRMLNILVEELPERSREVVRRTYLEDEALADASAALGISIARVSQIRSESLHWLRVGYNYLTGQAPLPNRFDPATRRLSRYCESVWRVFHSTQI